MLKVKTYGERNSGTNYLTKLLQLNLDIELLPGGVPLYFDRLFLSRELPKDLYFKMTYSKNLGWKHAVAPSPNKIRAVHMEEVVFITITKNPYAWLLSLFRRPHHSKRQYETFEAFLNTSWKTVNRENYLATHFQSPITLWNIKNRSYLGLRQAGRCLNLKYEDLLQSPPDLIQTIADTCGLHFDKTAFINLERGAKKGDEEKSFDDYQTYYLERQWQAQLNEGVLKIINDHLDHEVRELFGYRKYEG